MYEEVKYSEFVRALVKPGEETVKEMTPEKANLLHLSDALMIEAAELGDPIKKFCIYNKPFTQESIENMLEELGDIEFFLEALYQALGKYEITREKAIAGNKVKLSKRYEGLVYTNLAAQNRADKQ